MRTTFLLFFLITNAIFNISCSAVKLGSGNPGSENFSGKSFEERLKQEDLEGYEEDHSMEQQMKDLINEYIQEQEWKPDEEIDKEAFKKMFVNLIQRGALKQGNGESLKKLADKILEKHEGPILVKNLEKYFDIRELTLTYSKMFSPISDL